MAEKVTVPGIVKMKREGKKITCLTAYDYSLARILDDAGVDVILVGDSVGSVVQGQPNTLAVTMDEMIYHTRIVARGCKRALVVGDMPFLSFQVGREEALRNAGRFLQEAGAEAIKLEGGRRMAETIRFLVERGVPVMAHIGLTPQSINTIGRPWARSVSRAVFLRASPPWGSSLQPQGAISPRLSPVKSSTSRRGVAWAPKGSSHSTATPSTTASS